MLILINILIITILLNTLAFLMENLLNLNAKKLSFECGFSPITTKKPSFSTNFLMVIMMFLIFDIEISFLIPLNMLKSSTPTNHSNIIISFAALLTIILIKEWNLNSLNWSK